MIKGRQTKLWSGTALLALSLAWGQASAEGLNDRIDKGADAVESKVIAWRQDFHANPELGNREFKTAEVVAAHLQRLGMEVKTKVAHTGVVGILKGGKPGPLIALRADMDALPVTEEVDVPFASKIKTTYNGRETGVMHACGHDAHTAILMGVAEIFAGMKDDLPGTVMFIFQPAEEMAPEGEKGGAKLMVEEGIFKDQKPAAVFGLHVSSGLPVGMIAYKAREITASSDRFSIDVKGSQTHGAMPWLGIDPIVTSAQIIMGLQTVPSRQVDVTKSPAVVTVGAINGGNRENIIPDSVRMIGTIRTFNEDVQNKTHEGVKRVAENIGAAAGAKVDVAIALGYPITFNNPELTAASVPALQRVAGADKVSLLPSPTTAGEDFSYFAREAPGFFFIVGITPPGKDPRTAAPNHSPRFYVDNAGLKLGVRALAAVAMDRMVRTN